MEGNRPFSGRLIISSAPPFVTRQFSRPEPSRYAGKQPFLRHDMLKLRHLILALCLQALTGCSLFADKPEPVPAPPPAPAPAPEPPPVVEAPPPPPAPAPKPVAKPRPAAKPGKATAGKAAAASTETSGAASSAAPNPKPAAKKTAPLNGPEWLQFCSIRQQSPTGVLCDANTLLAQPSAKVQVYVREPSLVRNTPGGRIQLREGLPRLYRFFVIP